MSSFLTAVHAAYAKGKLSKNELHLIGPCFWNVRSHFKYMQLIDTETQMSIIQLSNGKFLIIDTVPMDHHLRQKLDYLTDNGNNIEAVIGAHPFHTSSFLAFYEAYPKAAYYGTPRHIRRFAKIPWMGDLNDSHIRKIWEPDVEMRVPAGLSRKLIYFFSMSCFAYTFRS